MARYGYARLAPHSSREDSQLDALAAAGCDRVWTDTASGQARRPGWDAFLAQLAAGDELVITRLAGMASSVRHLLDIAAGLSEREIDLVVLEQSIDTTTPAGRGTFSTFATIAEMQTELRSEGTHEGLAAARARGRSGGRPPRLTSQQVDTARSMYDELGEDGTRRYTVDEIAAAFLVSRKTIYRHLAQDGSRRQPDKAIRRRRGRPSPQAGAPPAGSPESAAPGRDRPGAAVTCPHCGHEPSTREEALQQRDDLALVWLHQDHPDGPITEGHHCVHCQPHGNNTVTLTVECARCADGPILTGALAEGADAANATESLHAWLSQHGWQLAPELLCPHEPR